MDELGRIDLPNSHGDPGAAWRRIAELLASGEHSAAIVRDHGSGIEGGAVMASLHALSGYFFVWVFVCTFLAFCWREERRRRLERRRQFDARLAEIRHAAAADMLRGGVR
jgi:hypothetical protein